MPHNPEVAGSNPAPATKVKGRFSNREPALCCPVSIGLRTGMAGSRMAAYVCLGIKTVATVGGLRRRGLVGRFVEESRSSLGIHHVGPDLLFRCDRALRHGVVGHPRIELAARDEAKDGGN
jgi:hypothetical protein